MNQMRLVISVRPDGRAVRAPTARSPHHRARTAIGRRKLGVSHPKLDEVRIKIFPDCSALARVSLVRTHAFFAWAPIRDRAGRRAPHNNRG